ncbi:uncharacterized protein PGTG_20504, partial [Puccinia graminis f. sp. tritici CRL 75-36-700-3]
VMQSSAPFRKEFEQRVENEVQNDSTKSFPKFDAIVHNYNICQKQWTESSAQSVDVVGPQMPSRAGVGSANRQGITSGTALNAPARRTRLVFLAGPAELNSKATLSDNLRLLSAPCTRSKEATRHQDARKPPPMSQFQSQAKRMADFYRPRYQQSQNRQPPAPSQQQQQQKGGASAQVMEIGEVPDDLDDLDFRAMSLGEDILPPPTNPLLPESGT